MNRHPARLVVLCVQAAALACACFGPARSAEAVIVAHWGYLVTYSGDVVFQWEAAQWANEYFNDGAKDDGTVNTPMVLYFTQCFGGDWLASFDNSTGASLLGPGYDTVLFPYTAAYSANEVGKVAYYNGYHAGASPALTVDKSSELVHIFGVANKDDRETPLTSGDNRPIAGDQTYVIAWAGKPEGPDYMDVFNLETNLSSVPDTGLAVHLASGAGPYLPATKAALKDTLALVGFVLDPSNTDSFDMFVTDHGGEASVLIELPKLSLSSSLELLIPFLPDQLLGATQTPGNQGMLSFATLQPIPHPLLTQLMFSLNDELIDPTDILMSSIQLPAVQDPATLYTLYFDPGFFSAAMISDDRSFLQGLSITSGSEEEIELEWIALGTGDVRKFGAPIPEPITTPLLLLACGALWFRRRSV